MEIIFFTILEFFWNFSNMNYEFWTCNCDKNHAQNFLGAWTVYFGVSTVFSKPKNSEKKWNKFI